MSDVILKVENVSKLYRLGTVGTGTFGGDVERFWKTKILGQEDPFLKIGQTNERTSKEKSDFVWALKDINFEVKRGEVLGIIGKNGAGKSTLLKLLSRITSPTTGSIKSAGRMASLLEVGTGFHPELTGRENIFLNGAILGMTKKEIQRKFDEIVDFSGCELYIDTPTKRYSSGMTVRLGFAVAAFLDPEILVVDEVLAVGDAEFQKKAIGKMKEVSQGGGRTVLFVSHNMASVRALCQKGVVLDNGRTSYFGGIENALEMYINSNNSNCNSQLLFKASSYITVNSFLIDDRNDSFINVKDNKVNIKISGHINEDIVLEVEMRVFDADDKPLMFWTPGHAKNREERRHLKRGDFIINEKIDFPDNINNGTLKAIFYLTDPGHLIHTQLNNSIDLIFYNLKNMDKGLNFRLSEAGLLTL
jgi:lipopolysaccharide transport system ATP-binding protein